MKLNDSLCTINATFIYFIYKNRLNKHIEFIQEDICNGINFIVKVITMQIIITPCRFSEGESTEDDEHISLVIKGFLDESIWTHILVIV